VTGTGSRIGPFRHRPFLVYWVGGLVSNIGTWLQAVAASVFVYQLTNSAFAVGVLNFASFLPIFLFSVYGGSLADRFDRRRIVIWTHAVSGLIALALGIVTLAGGATEWMVIAVGFALNTSYAVAKPSLIAMLPQLVPREELPDAVSLNTLQFIIGQLIGPVLAAIIIGTLGAGDAFVINAFTFLGPIVAMVYLQRKGLGAQPVAKKDAATANIGVFAYIRQHTWIAFMLTAIVITSAGMEVIRTIAPALVAEQLQIPENNAGFIIAAQSAGSAIGVFLVVPLRRRGLSRKVAVIAMGIQAVGLVGTAFSPVLAVAMFFVMLVGMGFSLCFPTLTGSLQLGVHEDLRGRVMSVHQVSHLGNRPFVALLTGALATIAVPLACFAWLIAAPFAVVSMRRGWKLLDVADGGEDAARG
jgi:MFS family permease